MLKSISIEHLFNLYSYQLQLTDNHISGITFLTGPNGYGKSTILSLVNAVFLSKYGFLFQTPFKSIAMAMEDFDGVNNYTLKITRTHLIEQSDHSDVQKEESVVLDYELRNDTTSSVVENFRVQSTDEVDMEGYNLALFLNNLPCYYITDQRVVSSQLIKEQHVKSMEQYDLVFFKQDLKGKLNAPIQEPDLLAKIDLLKKIMGAFSFVDKDFEVDKAFGFRFLMRDKYRTILDLDQLSSGEKHLFIQVYDLLFFVEENTLVLIDEPEISLHLAWQMSYLNMMLEIASFKHLQCIIATHSTEIFGNDFTSTIDLYEQSVQNGEC